MFNECFMDVVWMLDGCYIDVFLGGTQAGLVPRGDDEGDHGGAVPPRRLQRLDQLLHLQTNTAGSVK